MTRACVEAQAFGALGDGCTLNTRALQAAIDSAALQGAELRLGPGVYLTGSLFLKSGMSLRLDRGATLLGSRDLADYPLLPTRVAGIEMRWPAALVNIYGEHDVGLVGEGCIDGDGQVFWDSYWALRATYEPRGLRWASDYDCQRPRLVQVFESARVNIGDGLLLRRSGFWTLHLCYSEDVTVDRITIRNNDEARGPSTDGIDIDSSRRVTIRHADIAVNDDALCLKAGRDADGLRVARPCEDITISDCIVREGAAGLTFGSETSGGFRRITAERIAVHAPVPVGLLFKSAPTRGGFVEDVSISDLSLHDVPVVMRATMNWNPAYSQAQIPDAERANAPPHWLAMAQPVSREQGCTRVEGVRIQRLTARGAEVAFEVDATAEVPLRRFDFRSIDIEARRGGHVQDALAWHFDGDCRLQLGSPISVGESCQIAGLAPANWRVDSELRRRDVSALPMAEQDVQ
ncbi:MULTISPECIES: glycoside hydrolase family 28 protein [unclassified Roseateles]|uniref:glycoside hydrolase family 28 protein n=1 Tax=unclassified Roseateles TaxID=2626991 RepID=UPI0006F4A3B9|nr:MULTISPECIES: glycosyl hydrolase family 28 protein [unclassified Roseateles]KQW51757.1 exo-poly-alpha-D-galacturonosidase [Pelomonas sp. Root405]KRA77990.1 exo-poly-alpha-D-galacturonosidase [Pelomonas sp. Root662]